MAGHFEGQAVTNPKLPIQIPLRTLFKFYPITTVTAVLCMHPLLGHAGKTRIGWPGWNSETSNRTLPLEISGGTHNFCHDRKPHSFQMNAGAYSSASVWRDASDTKSH